LNDPRTLDLKGIDKGSSLLLQINKRQESEMIVLAHQSPAALERLRRDPDVVGRDGGSLLLEIIHELSVDLRRAKGHGMNLDLGLSEEFPQFARVLLELGSFAKAVCNSPITMDGRTMRFATAIRRCHRPPRLQLL
jgi:hypothetical protein